MTTSQTGSLLNQLRIDRRARQGKRRWPWVLAALAVLGVLAAIWISRGPLVVETAKARSAQDSGPISLLDASGFVTARRIATVSAKITGKVSEVLIEEGQQVQQGDVLARLDDTDAAAQFSLVEAQLASAESQLAEAEAQRKLAAQTLNRTRELTAKKLAPLSNLDTAKADFDARTARLVSLQKAIEVAVQQREVAAIAVDNTVIRAPFSGVIVAKSAQPGEMISPISAGGGFTRTGIGTLVDMQSLEVQVDVNEAYIGRVQPGMQVNAVLNAYPEWNIPGSVIAIVPTADRTKATVKVRIALDAQDSRIVPDMGVRVSFLQEEGSADAVTGVWVPARAIATFEGKPTVWIIENGEAVPKAVVTGTTRDADQLVREGLKTGDVVILSPAATLRSGHKVAAQP